MTAERAAPGEALGVAAAAWASTHRVQVGGRWIRYREAGVGPPVVLVHGLGMSADYWARTGPPLAAAGYRVLAPDLPGFGHTAGPEEGLSIGGQARALLRWARVMELGPATYVGHSLSCQSVVELAARRPETVRALVLAGPTGDGGTRRMVVEAWRLFLDAWRESLPLLVHATHAYLLAGPVRFLRTWYAGAHHDLLQLLPVVRAPTLVAVGADDPVVPASFAQKVVRLLPAGRLVVIRDGTHAVFFDQPERFNAAVLAFLADLG